MCWSARGGYAIYSPLDPILKSATVLQMCSTAFVWIKHTDLFIYTLDVFDTALPGFVAPCSRAGLRVAAGRRKSSLEYSCILKRCNVTDFSLMEVGQGVCFPAFSPQSLPVTSLQSNPSLKYMPVKIQVFCSYTAPTFGKLDLGIRSWVSIPLMLLEDKVQKSHGFFGPVLFFFTVAVLWMLGVYLSLAIKQNLTIYTSNDKFT